jgi:hypothetical protein
MKKLILSLIGLFLWFMGSSQGCLPQGITFSTQAQIDNFHTNYPNCTQIEGDVTISGANITNLNGLNGLTSIGGNLRICYDSTLSNLSGLGSLTSIAYNLFVGYNSVLTTLTGLNNVNHIGGALQFWYNYSLPNLTGLEAVTSIGGAFEIYNNHSLISLTGLNNITAIGGFIDITNNDTLTSLTALNHLASINGYLQVDFNNALKSLIGLDSIGFESITNLEIYHNDSLSNCSVQSICNFLLTGRRVQIYSNKTGCNSPQEVFNNCPYDLNVQNITSNNTFSLYPNPTSNLVTIETAVAPVISQLSIMNLNGQAVLTHQISEPKTTIDISNLPSGVYFVRVTNERTVEVGKFVKN